MDDKKQLIENTITDLVSCLLYYDRREDEDLQLHDIEDAISEGIITIEEIVGLFSSQLEESIKEYNV